MRPGVCSGAMSQRALIEDFIALSEAAAQALARLVPAHAARYGGEEALSLLARAISLLIPVYARAREGAVPRRVRDADLLVGRFEDGGAKLILSAGTACSPLVREADLPGAIERIVQDYIGMNRGAGRRPGTAI
jgi:hypothetical protein